MTKSICKNKSQLNRRLYHAHGWEGCPYGSWTYFTRFLLVTSESILLLGFCVWVQEHRNHILTSREERRKLSFLLTAWGLCTSFCLHSYGFTYHIKLKFPLFQVSACLCYSKLIQVPVKPPMTFFIVFDKLNLKFLWNNNTHIPGNGKKEVRKRKGQSL